MRGLKCVSKGKRANREEETSTDRRTEKGKGRVVFLFRSITVIYLAALACVCFVGTVMARIGPEMKSCLMALQRTDRLE